MSETSATFVIVGGGIAGVTCAETLAFYTPTESIILLSESALVKTVVNLRAITQTLSDFNIEESHMSNLMQKYPNITVIIDKLDEINSEEQKITTVNKTVINYKFLCLCMGAQPRLIPEVENNPFVIGIRDTDSVETFIQKLKTSKEVVIVGNGGIASELVYKIEDTKVHWIIKDKHITATFIDPGAAEFLKDRLNNKQKEISVENAQFSQRMRYETDQNIKKAGAALGPDWYKHLDIKGALNVPETVQIHYETCVQNIKTTQNGLIVKLTNDSEISCDLLVSATGVTPNSHFKISQPLHTSQDGGILVNEFMQSSNENIYVAGDLCTANWQHAPQWFPMKLWTQARQMGCYAARAMSSKHLNEEIYQDFCFELFTHTTRLFGYKVVLLGLHNAQKLGKDYEILFRMTKDVEYIKLVLQNDRLQGAVLIGDTELEEMCENLILNQIDLSAHKDSLLDPDIDIEDYFD